MPRSVHRCNQKGVTICVIYEASETFTICTCSRVPLYRVLITNKGNQLELTHQTENDIGEVMHKNGTYMWLIRLPQKVVFRDELCFEGTVEVEAYSSDEKLKVLRIGVHFGDQVCRYCHELHGESCSGAGMNLSCEFDLMKLMANKLSQIQRDRTTHELHDQTEEEEANDEESK